MPIGKNFSFTESGLLHRKGVIFDANNLKIFNYHSEGWGNITFSFLSKNEAITIIGKNKSPFTNGVLSTNGKKFNLKNIEKRNKFWTLKNRRSITAIIIDSKEYVFAYDDWSWDVSYEKEIIGKITNDKININIDNDEVIKILVCLLVTFNSMSTSA